MSLEETIKELLLNSLSSHIAVCQDMLINIEAGLIPNLDVGNWTLEQRKRYQDSVKQFHDTYSRSHSVLDLVESVIWVIDEHDEQAEEEE